MNQYIFPFPEFFTVTVGTPRVIDMRNKVAPFVITARPGASGSMLVEISSSVNAVDTVDGAPAAVWFEWPAGSVTVDTMDDLNAGVSAIRATATTANGYLEVVR